MVFSWFSLGRPTYIKIYPIVELMISTSFWKEKEIQAKYLVFAYHLGQWARSPCEIPRYVFSCDIAF